MGGSDRGVALVSGAGGGIVDALLATGRLPFTTGIRTDDGGGGGVQLHRV